MKRLVYEAWMLWNPVTGMGRRWKYYDDGSMDTEDFPMCAPVIYTPIIF